jgi:hypothetical protein
MKVTRVPGEMVIDRGLAPLEVIVMVSVAVGVPPPPLGELGLELPPLQPATAASRTNAPADLLIRRRRIRRTSSRC